MGRTCVCSQVPSDNPAPLLEPIQAIRDTRERRANNRHIQVGNKEPDQQPVINPSVSLLDSAESRGVDVAGHLPYRGKDESPSRRIDDFTARRRRPLGRPLFSLIPTPLGRPDESFPRDGLGESDMARHGDQPCRRTQVLQV